MNMSGLDWMIVVCFLGILTLGALYTQRFTKSVSAFLAAERCGGRYLLSVANGMAQLGVITLVMFFELNYEVGFTSQWWGMITFPIGIIMAITGWVYYRFRQTRALTLAQFFEMRYSRNFRVFSGLISFLAGVINFAIFPAIGARFFIWLCGIPPEFEFLGISAYPLVMLCLLATSLFFTFLGGQIAIMITDFIQGTFANVIFAVVVLFLLTQIEWSHIADTLMAAEPGKSMVNPFDLGKEENFNVWFYVISVIIMFYNAMGWQGTAGYNSSAKSPHESKMAIMLGGWRWYVFIPLVVIVIPLCARTYMTHTDYTAQSTEIKQQMDQVAVQAIIDQIKSQVDKKEIIDQSILQEYSIQVDVEEIIDQTAADILKDGLIKPPAEPIELQRQARTPLFLGSFLGKGLLGLLCAAMLGAFISTHDTYLHSWGSILIQDVILPFKKKPLTPKQHMWALRGSIFLVAVWIFVFSLYFKQSQHIIMFTAVTASIFTGGVGMAIIGGLYWKRGSTQAAWSTMILGMSLSFLGIFITQADSDYFVRAQEMAFWQELGNRFAAIKLDGFYWNSLETILDLTGQEVSFWIIGLCVANYILVSLIGPKANINMDKLLHRGKYAIEGEDSTSFKEGHTLLQKLGISREFTFWDKVVAAITLGWPLIWFTIFLLGNSYQLYSKAGISDEAWLAFWHKWMWLIFGISVALTIWFFLGGLRDIVYMFRKLRSSSLDEADDGRVTDSVAEAQDNDIE